MLGLVVLAVGIWFLVQPKVVVSDTYSHRSGAHFFTASGATVRQWMPENTVTEAGVSA